MPSRFSQQRGIVLVIVLWVITLLTIMAGSFAYFTRTETALAANGVERAQARALAEASLAYFMLRVLNPTGPEDTLAQDGGTLEWRFGRGVMQINGVPSNARIDLNSADHNLLKGLFTEFGMADEDSESLVDAIEDWRDPDDLRRPHGAELAEYQAAGSPFGPKNAPFDAVEELQQVLGMTPELYQQVAGSLTVYSRQSSINAAAAPMTVLKAVPGVDADMLDEYVKLRADNREHGLPPPPPPAGGYWGGGRASAYQVSIDVGLDTGAHVVVEAVVTLGGLAGEPYRVLAWRENR